MKTLRQIQNEVHEWGVCNFGMSPTPYLAVLEAGTIRPGVPSNKDDKADTMARHGGLVACLDSLAPLMGMAEELGELAEAARFCSTRAIEDAVGDIGVYLCDYCAREKILLPVAPPEDFGRFDHTTGLVVYVGRLMRAHLKHHQRIRGFHDMAVFHKHRDDAVRGLVHSLEAYAKAETKTNFITILNTTWNTVVSKRDWKTDGQSGGGHTHEAKA